MTGQFDIDLDFGVIVDFAARNPNIGGEVIFDRDRPDRDVFVFDVNALGAPLQVIEGVSTLLYGFESAGERVFVTSTDGRNDLDGLEDLENRMFENRLSYFDCTPVCARRSARGPRRQPPRRAGPDALRHPAPAPTARRS